MTDTTTASASRAAVLSERARTARNGALACIAVLVVVVLLIDAALLAMTGEEPELFESDVVRALGGTALLVACLAQVVRLGAATLVELEQVETRGLPVSGVWARGVFRATATATGACWLLALGISLPAIPQESLPATGVIGVLATVSVLTALVAIASGVIWFAAEVVAGYREARRR